MCGDEEGEREMREVWVQAGEGAVGEGRAAMGRGRVRPLGVRCRLHAGRLLNAWSLTCVGRHDASARQMLGIPRASLLRHGLQVVHCPSLCGRQGRLTRPSGRHGRRSIVSVTQYIEPLKHTRLCRLVGIGVAVEVVFAKSFSLP